MNSEISNNRIQGLVAAPFTPFHDDGNLALDVVPDYARWLKQNGVVGAFVVGTTGEGLSLTIGERKQLAEAWAAAVPPDFRLIVHVGHTCLADCQDLAAHAQQVGASAIGTMAPCFFRPATVEVLVAWCRAIAASAPELPFYFYHLPCLTGVELPVTEFLAQARRRIPNLAGIKYTHGNLDEFAQLLEDAGNDYDVLFGRDQMLLQALRRGATSAIGSTYNFAAPLYQDLIQAYHQGQTDRAETLQQLACQMIEACQNCGAGELPGLKKTMSLWAIPCGPVRPPLQNLTSEHVSRLEDALRTIGLSDGYVSPAGSAPE